MEIILFLSTKFTYLNAEYAIQNGLRIAVYITKYKQKKIIAQPIVAVFSRKRETENKIKIQIETILNKCNSPY